MSLAHRIAELYQAKVNALLDRAEDSREMLGYSYVQQQEFLRLMRSAVTDMTAGRKRAEVQENELRRAADRLRAGAAQAVTAGKEDFGREALAHRAEMIAHADDLAAERMALHVEEERLSDEARRLEARFEVVRYRKEALKAAYTAAKAAPAGTLVGSRVAAGDVAEAARRTEDQTAALQARAQALSEQIKVGMPETPPSPEAYRIQERLDALTRGRSGRGGTGQDQGAAGCACQETAARRIARDSRLIRVRPLVEGLVRGVSENNCRGSAGSVDADDDGGDPRAGGLWVPSWRTFVHVLGGHGRD